MALNLSRPTAIPGVRIAHIGGSNRTVREIRTYWQSRGAIFMPHSFEEEHDQTALGAILTCADIVFHTHSGARPQTKQHLALFCERAGKPLIPFEETSLSCLEEALTAWCPMRKLFAVTWR